MIGRGVAVIYQEPSLAPNLSVAENIFMGRLPTSRFGIVDRRRLATDTTTVAERLGLDLDPRCPRRPLSVARRQMVEIAKASRVTPASSSWTSRRPFWPRPSSMG